MLYYIKSYIISIINVARIKERRGENMKNIQVEGLTKIYGEGENKVVAVNNISFSIEEGEFVVITGASGSRKIHIIIYIGRLRETYFRKCESR